ncbi:hypothetical protein [Actinomadura gamaensis]|uniref:Uncharacterized protein n=1 Tax=Actinomadura gamaensis TaxID=1763541 RepID=A0ABV9TYB0_9ACTN
MHERTEPSAESRLVFRGHRTSRTGRTGATSRTGRTGATSRTGRTGGTSRTSHTGRRQPPRTAADRAEHGPAGPGR